MDRRNLGRMLVVASIVVACAGILLNETWNPRFSTIANIASGRITYHPRNELTCPFGPDQPFYWAHDTFKNIDRNFPAYGEVPDWATLQYPSDCARWIETRWVLLTAAVMMAIGLFYLWSVTKKT